LHGASDTDVAALARAIDGAQRDLPALANFIHPGGSFAGAYLHLARAVCRRAERAMITLGERETGIRPEGMRFLNRLSDALFVWARWINAEAREPEALWNSAARPPER